MTAPSPPSPDPRLAAARELAGLLLLLAGTTGLAAVAFLTHLMLGYTLLCVYGIVAGRALTTSTVED